MARVGGTVFLKIDGVQFKVKGDFDYSLGRDKKEMVVGVDGVHGHTVKPQMPYLEGTITDSKDVDVAKLQDLENADVFLELANGKKVAFEGGIYASEGKINTAEGEIELRIEAISASEYV